MFEINISQFPTEVASNDGDRYLLSGWAGLALNWDQIWTVIFIIHHTIHSGKLKAYRLQTDTEEIIRPMSFSTLSSETFIYLVLTEDTGNVSEVS